MGFELHRPLSGRQWFKVYDLCHAFLHVARVRKHTDMREFHGKTEVYDLCRTFLHVARVRKHTDMREKHANTTKSDTSGHCLLSGITLAEVPHFLEEIEGVDRYIKYIN